MRKNNILLLAVGISLVFSGCHLDSGKNMSEDPEAGNYFRMSNEFLALLGRWVPIEASESLEKTSNYIVKIVGPKSSKESCFSRLADLSKSAPTVLEVTLDHANNTMSIIYEKKGIARYDVKFFFRFDDHDLLQDIRYGEGIIDLNPHPTYVPK